MMMMMMDEEEVIVVSDDDEEEVIVVSDMTSFAITYHIEAAARAGDLHAMQQFISQDLTLSIIGPA